MRWVGDWTPYHFAATTTLVDGDRESKDFNSKWKECQSLFTATSKDLYRKQMLAEEVLLSCNDYLLYSRSEEDEDMFAAGSKEERDSTNSYIPFKRIRAK
jgi:hypothetical protein